MALFDISGTEIASSDDISYGGDTIDVDTIAGLASSNTSTSDDSFLFNIVLDPGTYFLEVRATDVDISDNPNSGDQYFLVTSLVPSAVAIPEPSSTILLALALTSGLLVRRRNLTDCFDRFTLSPQQTTANSLGCSESCQRVLKCVRTSFQIVPQGNVRE